MKTTLMTKLTDVFPGLDAKVILEDVIGVTNIIDSGEEIIHSCPLPFGLHRNGDKNPSASLNRETLLFNCFTCGGGSIIWLVENCLNVGREEAIAILKEEVTSLRLVPVEDFINKLEEIFHEEDSKEDIPVYSEIILNRWRDNCEYLTERGVSEEIQRVMKTGVDRNRIEIARINGLEENVKLDRVVLPHFMDGKLVGWVARKIQDIQGVPKYRNSKGFPRGQWMYNLDNARKYNWVYVVESPMSVLVLKSRGIENVVATFGAKVDDNQIRLLRNFSRVTVFMDGDAAGRGATEKIVSKLSRYTNLTVVDTPEDEDPASLPEIPDGIPAIEWELRKYINK
jgi:DNA primase